AYHIVQWTVWGQTLGKLLVGIKIVGADGKKPGFVRSLARLIGYFFSLALGGVGFLMIALNGRKQALHDRLAETYVVPETPRVAVPRGLPGYAVSDGERSSAMIRPQMAARRQPPVAAATVAGNQGYETVQIAPGPSLG